MSVPSCLFTSQPSPLSFSCIGRNQAAAATSEQFGEIAHWGETHSLERMSLSLKPLAVINAPCWIRTSDRLLRRQLLYPAELREHSPILTVDVLHPA